MMVKDFNLNGIVPWGRTLSEYCAFFGLDRGTLSTLGSILDVGGGPSSFAAEATGLGIHVTAVDPIYSADGAFIRRRFDEAYPAMLQGMLRASTRFLWKQYSSPEEVLTIRRQALDRFLSDFDEGKESGRYITGELPQLPFATDQFQLALCSHLLFLYSEELDEAFHLTSLIEMLRVAREVRVFPLVSLDGTPSPYIRSTMNALHERGLHHELTEVPFEFQKGAREMLRAWRSEL